MEGYINTAEVTFAVERVVGIGSLIELRESGTSSPVWVKYTEDRFGAVTVSYYSTPDLVSEYQPSGRLVHPSEVQAGVLQVISDRLGRVVDQLDTIVTPPVDPSEPVESPSIKLILEDVSASPVMIVDGDE